MVGGASDDSIRARKGLFSIGMKVTHHGKEPAEPTTGIKSIFLAIRCCRVICQGLAHSAFFFFLFSFFFFFFLGLQRDGRSRMIRGAAERMPFFNAASRQDPSPFRLLVRSERASFFRAP